MSFLNNLLNKSKDLVTYTEEERSQGKKPNLFERIPMRTNQRIEKIQDFFKPTPDKVRTRDFVRELPEATFNVAKEIAQGTARSFDFAGRKLINTLGDFPEYENIKDQPDNPTTNIIFGGNERRADDLGGVAQSELNIDPDKNPILAPLAGGTLVGLDLIPGGQGKAKGIKGLIKGLTDDTITTIAKTTDPKIIEGVIRDTTKTLDDNTVKALSDGLSKIDNEDGIKRTLNDLANQKPKNKTPQKKDPEDTSLQSLTLNNDDVFYHGTTKENKESIINNGINTSQNTKGFAEQPEAFYAGSKSEAEMYGDDIVGIKVKPEEEVNVLDMSSQEWADTVGRSTNTQETSEALKEIRSRGYDVINNGDEIEILNPNKFEVFDSKPRTVTTKILEDLQGKGNVSKQYILDATNRGDVKQQERELIRKVAEQFDGKKVNVDEFTRAVEDELLPITRQSKESAITTRKKAVTELKNKGIEIDYDMSGDYFPVDKNGEYIEYDDLTEGQQKLWYQATGDAETFDDIGRTNQYEDISLSSDIRGDVANYDERIYESPIKTQAGDVHFSGQTENYFGHTRIEDMADNETRRVIEVQSDLYQGGNIKQDLQSAIKEKARVQDRLKSGNISQEKANKHIKKLDDDIESNKKLATYGNPTAHFRMVREEIADAIKAGKKKLQFPTGETAMKIEGLGVNNNTLWTYAENGKYAGDLKPDILEVGMNVAQEGPGMDGRWLITDVLGDGKFKAIPDYRLPKITYYKNTNRTRVDEPSRRFIKTGSYSMEEWIKERGSEQLKESFDISGKIDKENPIYRFYEKTLGKYLKKQGAEKVTDENGVQWYEINLEGKTPQPVEAFGMVAGIEQDEDGNISFDPVKAGIGIAGAGLAKNINLNGAEPGKLLARLKAIENSSNYQEAMYRVGSQIDASEVGYTMKPLDNGRDVGFRYSTYPKWIPEELRSKELMEKVYNLISSGKEPAKNATRQRRLYDAFLTEMESSVKNTDEYVMQQLAKDTEVTPSMINGSEINEFRNYDIDPGTIKNQEDLIQARADLAKNKVIESVTDEYKPGLEKGFEEVAKETSKLTDRRMRDAEEIGIDADVMANAIHSKAGGRLTHAEAENLSETVRAPIQDLIDKTPQQLGTDRVKMEAYSQELEGFLQRDVKRLKAETLAHPDDKVFQEAYQNLSKRYVDARAGLEAWITEAGRLVEGAKMIGKRSRVPGVNGRVQQIRNNLIKFSKRNPDKYGGLPADFDIALDAIDINNPTQVMRFLTKWNKTSFIRKLSEAQKAFLLSALSTHSTNALGNLIQQIMDIPVRGLAGALDTVASKATGRPQEVFPEEALGQIRGAFKAMPETIQNAIKGLKNEHFGFELRRTEIEQGTPVPTIKGKLGEIIRLPFRLLQSADLAFRTVKKGAEEQALAVRIAKKEGLTGQAYKNRVKELSKVPPVDQIDLIDARTERSLMLEDLDGILKTIEDTKNKYPAVQFIIPFYRTLINLSKEAYRMTPIRMIGQGVGKTVGTVNKGAGRKVTDMFSDQWTRDKATRMEEISRQIIGTSIMAYITTMMLTDDIDVTGASPRKAGDREVLYGQGKMPHSIRIGDKWVEFQRVQPIGQLMQIAGSIAESIKAYQNEGQLNSEDVRKNVWKGIGNLTSMVFTQSPFTGVSDLFDLMKGGAYNEGISKAFPRYIGQLIGTFIPNILRRTTTAIDPIIYEKRGIRPQLQSRIPGLQDELTPKRDLFGEIVRQGGTPVSRFGSPIRTSDVKSNQLFEEFETIGYTPTVPRRNAFNTDLSAKEYETLQRYYGPRLRDELWDITNSTSYQNLNDFQKQKIIDRVSRKVLNLARQKLFPIYAEKNQYRKQWEQQGYTGKEIEEALDIKYPYSQKDLERYAQAILTQEQEQGNARLTIEELLNR